MLWRQNDGKKLVGSFVNTIVDFLKGRLDKGFCLAMLAPAAIYSHSFGAVAISITALGIMTLSITFKNAAHSINMLSTMTLSITFKKCHTLHNKLT
jgi:hypothetical protein